MKKSFLLLLPFALLSPQIAFAKLNCPSKEVAHRLYDHTILKASRLHRVDVELIHAVINQESCYDFKAISRVGAEGLMQLMPATAVRFNVNDSFNPTQNIYAGTKYLAWLLKRFDGNIKFAVAGYNAGEGKVDKYKGIPPYKETKNYVKSVLKNYHRLKSKRLIMAKNTNKEITIDRVDISIQHQANKLYVDLKPNIFPANKKNSLGSKTIIAQTKKEKIVPEFNNVTHNKSRKNHIIDAYHLAVKSKGNIPKFAQTEKTNKFYSLLSQQDNNFYKIKKDKIIN